MSITIRTKQAQLVDPARNLSEVVYLEITDKWHRYEDDLLTFEILYYFLHNGKKTPVEFKSKQRTLTAQEANYVASQITATGDNYIDVERSYTLAGAFAIVAADSEDNWGLTADDWEVVN